MKHIFILILSLFFSFSVTAQDDLYYSREKKDTIKIASDIENIKFCLGKYHAQRQTGLLFSFSGAAILTASAFVSTEEKTAQTGLAIAGGAFMLTGACITLNAEKWLKKASIKVSPGSLRITF